MTPTNSLDELVAELREEQKWQGECYRLGNPYTNCVGHLDRAADTLERLRDALTTAKAVISAEPFFDTDPDLIEVVAKIDTALSSNQETGR